MGHERATVPEAPRFRWPKRPVLQIGIAERYVVIAWKPPLGVEASRFLIREQSGLFARVVSGAASSLLVDGLEPGTRYKVVITAEVDGHWHEVSSQAWVRTGGVNEARVRRWEMRELRERKDDWGSVYDLLDRAAEYPVLGRQEEVQLGKAIEAEGIYGPSFWRFALSNLRLVVHWARRNRARVRGTIIDHDDLVQIGFEGLLAAVERWDWRRGFKFSTYASWWIRQKIDREVANLGRTIRLPVYMIDQVNQAHAVQQEFGLYGAGQVRELAGLLGMTREEVRELLDLAQPLLPLAEVSRHLREIERTEDLALLGDDAWVLETLDGAFQPGDASASYRFTTDLIALASRSEMFVDHNVQDSLARVVDVQATTPVLTEWRRLPERERRIIDLRYGLSNGRPRTLEEIGKEFRLTRERIRQLIKLAEETIREALLPPR